MLNHEPYLRCNMWHRDSTKRLALVTLVWALSSLVATNANSKCMDKKKYDELPAQWVSIRPPNSSLAAERLWPPEGQEVLFYFDEPRMSGPEKGQFTRFRFGYVSTGTCNAMLTGRHLNIIFPLFQLASYEPTHWMPLTYIK
ncbi:hypothetical protein [Chitinivorax sp. B]|uniref:hypothetical protein n=1 Tax=Chitinivorax sp. B TaxID=2502235 RepID=UPI0014855B72|nr:hypothetical protein [Chitinivorax sp. B]